MFDAKLNYQNKVILNNQELLGVESITMGFAVQSNVSKPLGSNMGVTTMSQDTSKTLSISRNLIYNDNLTGYNANNPINGNIQYDNNVYGFTSGYLTDYMVNCSVGNIPKVTTNMIIFGQMNNGISYPSTVAAPSIYIPNQGSISIQCDGSSTNRVIGFDYSFKMNRKPIYTIGSIYPSYVEALSPNDYSATVQIEVDDAILSDPKNFIYQKENKNVNINIKGRNGDYLQSLSIPNATLISQQLSASADGVLKLTLSYMGHG